MLFLGLVNATLALANVVVEQYGMAAFCGLSAAYCFYLLMMEE